MNDRERMLRAAASAKAPPATRMTPRGDSHPVLDLQRTVGNREVARLIGGEDREAQAERVADQVANAAHGRGGPVAPLHVPADGGTDLPAGVRSTIAQPGRPLDPGTQAHMESHFGFDFSGVRVHDDAHAAQSAKGLGARAYTAGSHIAFGARQFAPGTSEGTRLLAHELAHVVQQSRGGAIGLDRAPEIDLERMMRDTKMTKFGQRSTKEGKAASLVLFAEGVQIYESKEKGGVPVWDLVAPEADLFDERGLRIGRHYGGPTWECEWDGSKVVGNLPKRDPAPTNDGAIPWLEMPVQSSSMGDGLFSGVTLIRRVETRAGAAPKKAPAATGRIRVPYQAIYYFFK